MLTNSKVDGDDREISINNKITLAHQIQEDKESNKFEQSATIVVSSTNAQKRLSDDTPSPTHMVVLRNNTSSTNRKRKEIKDVSPGIEVSLDEIIEIALLDLANLTLEQTILLQEFLTKKKRQEEIRREHKQKQVLNDVNHTFVDAFVIHNFEEGAPIINQIVNIVDQVNDGDMESNVKFSNQEDLIKKKI